ncbi:hypothetical protein MHPYR_780010 [uncultured Mycobacterium sp.]|uniref:Uncharacterized protein n=1 Tax=uncultured Mycobacterium sp. TaxID=171292 RepID=A0A1Y5PKY2_9MYCO|nr:hypothetical protein MHPYR_780010 [uncultured Mycobacterium sp.]
MCDTTARYRSFRHELNRELVALDGQAEKLHAELTEHVRYNRSLDAFRVQGDLRSVAVNRRSVVNMLSAIACRFPSN